MAASAPTPAPLPPPDDSGWLLFRNPLPQQPGVGRSDAAVAATPQPAAIRPRSDRLPAWPEPPPWRQFLQFDTDPKSQEQRQELEQQESGYWDACEQWLADNPRLNQASRDQRRGQVFRLPRGEDGQLTDAARQVQLAVNAAIHLRRPLLVTGTPGCGKSSLAHAIAVELQLGPVLTWAVTPRSQLLDGGLYLYDAVGRLQDSDLRNAAGRRLPSPPCSNYLTLGPVGTAFLPFRLPRVLLIDELDKGDLQLPHELLHLFEEGSFEIPPLVRDSRKQQSRGQEVRTADLAGRWSIREGRVQCRQFPIIVLTSNGEREFPPAFHRRCIRVSMPAPTAADLQHVVEAHFGATDATAAAALRHEIEAFLESDGQLDRATDQLLNAWHLLRNPDSRPSDPTHQNELRDILLQLLNG